MRGGVNHLGKKPIQNETPNLQNNPRWSFYRTRHLRKYVWWEKRSPLVIGGAVMFRPSPPLADHYNHEAHF